MSDPFDDVSDPELTRLRALLDRIAAKHINDAGKGFVAQMLGMGRLISSQSAANAAMLKAQDDGHREMLDEQRSLVKWQKVATLATGLMVIITGIYAYETRAIVQSNNRMAHAAQEQVELIKEQMRDAARPRLFVDLDQSNTSALFESLLHHPFNYRFELINRGAPAAYNIRCRVSVLLGGKRVWSSLAACRDTLFSNFSDSGAIDLPPNLLVSLVNSKAKSSSWIETKVTYQDSTNGGKTYSAVRLVEAVSEGPSGFYLKSTSFQAD